MVVAGARLRAEGEFTPSLSASSTSAGHCRSHSSIWLRTGAGFSSATAPTRSPTPISAASATTTSTMATPSDIANCSACPGSKSIPERQVVREIDGRVESAAAALRSSRPPGFYASWLRPAVFATALVTNPEASDERVDSYNVGTAIRLAVAGHASSADDALVRVCARLRGQRAGEDEFMLSFKVL